LLVYFILLSTNQIVAFEMTNFEEAVEKVKQLKQSPNNDELLEVYALYKQATVGENTTPKPGMFDLKGKAKWEAWNGKKGVSQEEAKQKYVAKYDELAAKYGTN